MLNIRFRRYGKGSRRHGAIIVLAAAVMVMICAFAAFTVDSGYMTIVKADLQKAADAAALGAVNELANGPTAVRTAAKNIAAGNPVGGKTLNLADADIQIGTWKTDNKTFTIDETSGNAVKITAKAMNEKLFFAPVIGHKTFNMQAKASAMNSPRDIVFVVDLSGSMNDDSEPCWATGLINSEFAPAGFPTVGNTLIQNLFTDLGFGSYPGTTQYIGQGQSGVSQNSNAYTQLTANGGPLTPGSVASAYRILSGDSTATRKTKAYKWMIDKQIAVLMPNAKPAPNTTTNFNYWSAYLDYLITPSGSLPPSQDADRIDDFNNPNGASYPDASVSLPQAWRNKIGYVTYTQFMMDWGRDRSPDVDNSTNSAVGVGTKTMLSTLSAHCPYHSESTPGGTFDFPPREQPTHASRRALIAAIQVIKEMNEHLSTSTSDRVALVTFDAIDAYHAPKLVCSLTSDYDSVMLACTKLQAVGDINSSTATENGLILGKTHVLPTSQGGQGRSYTSKLVVLLTDGMPNLYESSNTAIANYMSANSNSDWYGSSRAYNAAMMQADILQGKKAQMFPVGIGLGTDYDFMDRMARTSGTAANGQSPRGSGNPAEYEQRLTEIFTTILTNPGSRLVQ